MIFKQIDDILAGKKTQTRRIRKDTEWHDGKWATDTITKVEIIQEDDYRGRLKWQIGRCYSIVPKRGAAGIGRKIRITGIRIEPLHHITEQEAQAEGVASVEEYRALWESINGKDKQARWDVNPTVWVLDFELVKESETQ